MFKLLTEEGMAIVLREYKRRRIAAILGALILVLVVAIVSLLPSYVLSTVRRVEVAERVKIASGMRVRGDEAELEEWLSRTNSILGVISAEPSIGQPSKLIEDIAGERVPGIFMTSFSWKKNKDVYVLSAQGIANNRQELIAFRDNLDGSGSFSLVDLPLSNLTVDKNINFQITLTPK